jgi:hypothetical protein
MTHRNRQVHRSLRKNAILYQGTTLQAAEKLCFVSGHGFSRAVKSHSYEGFSP